MAYQEREQVLPHRCLFLVDGAFLQETVKFSLAIMFIGRRFETFFPPCMSKILGFGALKSCSKEAKSIVASSPLTYKGQTRFKNKRLLVKSQLKILFNLPLVSQGVGIP